MQTDSRLIIENLVIGYTDKKKKIALGAPIQASAKSGELIALIGPNGVGKSTLIKTLCNLQAAHSGIIAIDGISHLHLSRNIFAKKISLVSTEMVRFSKLSVADVVALGRFPYGTWYQNTTSADQHIITEALQNVGMLGFKQREITGLSDGEYQRVMIARALAQDTPILILDEPTAFLDLANKYAVVHLLWKLARTKNKIILFSTHDINVAMQFADLFWVMTSAKLKTGAPEDLLLDHTIEQLYNDSQLVFDSESSQFKIQHNNTYNIHIHGNKHHFSITKMALERMGFLVDCNKNCDLVVSIVEHDQQLCWRLNNTGNSEFKSIYELQQYLMMLKK
jgi:iron complex transport system ATP-binding protein